MRIQLVQVVVATHNAPPDRGDHGKAMAMAGSMGAFLNNTNPKDMRVTLDHDRAEIT